MTNGDFRLQKNQIMRSELHFSCQNVNFCFGGRYDESDARNKNKPYQHLEICPKSFFENLKRRSEHLKPLQADSGPGSVSIGESAFFWVGFMSLRASETSEWPSKRKFVCPENARRPTVA